MAGYSAASRSSTPPQGGSERIKVFAGEPIQANDAAQSLRDGKIFRFEQAPETVADGARTLGISERTFQYIKQCDGIFEITEQEIMYWTQWVTHLLKVTCEPSSALSMCAAFRWLEAQTEPQTALVILSGGNISDESYRQIWHKNHLETIPRLQPKP
jgi:threonine dehydratase